MDWDTYALDAEGYDQDGLRCWVPLEEDGTLVLGMNYISDLPPESCKHIAVFHPGGQDACEAWCEEHNDELNAMKEELEARNAKVERR